MDRKNGFTLVELLIVIVVIGILAAIVIVAFNSVQSRAADTVIKTDLNNLAKRLETLRITTDYYPSDDPQALETMGVRIVKSNYAVSPQTPLNLAYCRDFSGPISPVSGFGFAKKYVMIVISRSGKKFAISSEFAMKEISPANTPNSGINTADINDENCSYFGAGYQRTYAGYDPTDKYPYPGDTLPWRKWISSNATY